MDMSEVEKMEKVVLVASLSLLCAIKSIVDLGVVGRVCWKCYGI
jgi:hypothetical protein